MMQTKKVSRQILKFQNKENVDPLRMFWFGADFPLLALATCALAPSCTRTPSCALALPWSGARDFVDTLASVTSQGNFLRWARELLRPGSRASAAGCPEGPPSETFTTFCNIFFSSPASLNIAYHVPAHLRKKIGGFWGVVHAPPRPPHPHPLPSYNQFRSFSFFRQIVQIIGWGPPPSGFASPSPSRKFLIRHQFHLE